MPWQSHTPKFDHTDNIWSEVLSQSSSLCNFLLHPISSLIICPSNLFSTLISDNLSRSSLKVRDHISYLYPTYFNTIFLNSEWQDKTSCDRSSRKYSPNLTSYYFFISVIAKYQISATLANQFCPKNLRILFTHNINIPWAPPSPLVLLFSSLCIPFQASSYA